MGAHGRGKPRGFQVPTTYDHAANIGDRLTNPNLEFTLFTDRSLSFNTATRLLLLDLQALAALERA